MSLLDNPRDVIALYPEVEATDDLGNVIRVPSDTPVMVGGRCQPVSSEESAAAGQSVATVYRFITRAFLAGAFARATWRDRDWDVLGEPMRHNGSEATRHVTVLLRARTAEPIGGQ